MKRVHAPPAIMLSLISWLSIGAAFAAPTRPPEPTAPMTAAIASNVAVYQRQNDSGAIELSNIPAEGAQPLPSSPEINVLSGSSASETKPMVSEPAATAHTKAKKKVLKTIKKPDGTEEEVWVDSDEDVDGTDTAARDATQGETMPGTPSSLSNNSWSSAAPRSSGDGYPGGGYSGGGLSGGSVDNGSSTPTSGGNPTAGGTPTSGGNSGGASPGIPVDPTLPKPTSALETKLNNYRNMMLNEVVASKVVNPAITRRYQMVNRSTYQSLSGY